MSLQRTSRGSGNRPPLCPAPKAGGSPLALSPHPISTPARSRTWTCSFGGSHDVPFTTRASRQWPRRELNPQHLSASPRVVFRLPTGPVVRRVVKDRQVRVPGGGRTRLSALGGRCLGRSATGT